jgi:hypothetical protein
LIRGFDIQIPSAGIPASSLQINVADSAILHASATESGTILMTSVDAPADTLNSVNTKVIGAFQNGVPNYIALDYRRITDASTVDQTSGWSPSQKIEYQRNVPIGKVLDYRYIITTTGFGTYMPLYIVGVNSSGGVQYITKATRSLFRLGMGGAVPNPHYQFDYSGLENPQTGNRREWVNEDPTLTPNPVTVQPGNTVNAFAFGDWSITSLKEWMDAVMTRFREITGSQYWYLDSALPEGSMGLSNVWWDSIGNVFTGRGNLTFNYILEATQPTDGAFQSQFTDNTILPGDSYVVGATSDSKATINSFNSNQLLVHSLTSRYFVYNEALYNRRLFRYNAALFSLTTWKDGANTYAQFKRIPSTTAVGVSITGWSYVGQEVTVTAPGHTFQPGQLVALSGLIASSGAPNGTQLVHSVSGNDFYLRATVPITGATSVSGALAKLDNQTAHPFFSRFNVTSWSYVGSTIRLVAPAHTFTDPGSVGDWIVVYGLTATTNAPNGKYQITAITAQGEIEFVAGAAPTGTAGVGTTSSVVPYDHDFLVTITKGTLDAYNVTNESAVVNLGIDFSYIIGPAALPPISDATGPIVADGIVAMSTVADPVRIESVAYSAGDIVVTTYNPHGYAATPAPASITLYGDPALSPYFRTYSGLTVSITIDPPTIFRIVGSGMGNYGTYSNPGTDDVFARSPNNPFPGPIQWDSDIIIKGVIGDKYFKIPVTATADGTATANLFNIGGVTGTAFLQDGEVAYIILERNQIVSSGAFFSCAGGANPIIGATAPLDIHNASLESGDFVKFEDEDESKWIRIDSVIGSTITLKTDKGLSPDTTQRPVKVGKLVYCKGAYSVVHVQPHYLVPANADIYWIGVRRDNYAEFAKVYLRSLELEVGESIQLSDNTTNNLLVYTGAGNESATNPNYTVIDQSGSYQYTENLDISAAPSVDALTRTITFDSAPTLGFQKGDIFTKGTDTYTVSDLISARTVLVNEDISGLLPADTVKYYRLNYNLTDSDNLTLALRKEDRELGKINTIFNKAVYDESVYCQRITMTGSDTIKSGDYIQLGSNIYAPTALAWVLHGTTPVNETIEGVLRSMPGGVWGSNSILVHVVSGTFTGGPIYQNGIVTNRNVSGVDSPQIPIDTELVLPPNRRTQIFGSGQYIVFPAHASYIASSDDTLTGENLLVIANDTIRQAGLDYLETFGGPKGKIQIKRLLPLNTRIRFRVMSNYGSPILAQAGLIDLQKAYDTGNVVNIIPGRPVDLRISGGAPTSETILKMKGSLELDGDSLGGVVGGIFPSVDQKMLIGSEDLKPKEAWTGLNAVKTHQSHPGSAWISKTAADSTTNSSARIVTGSDVVIPFDSVVRFTATAVARDENNGGSASFRLEGTFRRGSSGDVIANAYPITIINGPNGDGIDYAATLAIYDANADLTYESVAVVVYGVNAKTVFWAVCVDYQIIGTAS